jgi:hypothetical protein
MWLFLSDRSHLELGNSFFSYVPGQYLDISEKKRGKEDEDKQRTRVTRVVWVMREGKERDDFVCFVSASSASFIPGVIITDAGVSWTPFPRHNGCPD